MTDLAAAIRASAERLGIDPLDLGTAISYETAGTFDPWKAGPRTQWGQHRGLIQWGEPQRQKYGVREGMPVADQMRAVERYLADAGVRPGMKLLDVYSAINAGKVGRYGASDANNGGAPGTVRDKVERQMGGHRTKAQALLGGQPLGQSFQTAASAPVPNLGDGMPAVPAAPLPVDPGALAAAFGDTPQPQMQERQAAEQARRKALLGTMFV
jgi:hypothetical protein